MIVCSLWLTACVAQTLNPTPALDTSFDTPTLTPDTVFATSTNTPFPSATIVFTPTPTPENTPAIQFPLRSLIHDLHWSADGSQLAIAAGTDVHLYDASLKEQHIIALGLWAERIVFHPSQPVLGGALNDGSVRFWDTANGEETCKFTAHTKGANSLSFQPGGNLLATTGTDIISRMWDISSVLAGGCDVKPVGQLIGSSFTAPAITFSADGQTFALVDIKDVYLRESQTRKLIAVLGSDLSVFDIALSPDGHWLAVAQKDATLTLWDLTAKPKPTSTQLQLPLSKPKTYTWRVAFSADSHLLAGATSAGDLQVWGLPGLAPIFRRSLGRPLSALAFNPVTSMLAVGTLDGSVWFYAIE